MRLLSAPGLPVALCVVAICCSVRPTTAMSSGICFNSLIPCATGSNPRAVFAADLNGDNDFDLAVANAGNNNVTVLKGWSSWYGTFASVNSYAVGEFPVSVFAADLDNRDGVDLAVVNAASNNVSVLRNRLFGGIYSTAVNYAVGDSPLSVVGADLDGDNYVDLAVANGGSDDVAILRNNGNGTFALAVNYAAGDLPSSIVASDLDGDNYVDLAVANETSDNVSVMKNNGDGTFASAVHYPAGNGPVSVFATDLDGDHDIDLAVAAVNPSPPFHISVLRNNGNGTFAAAVNYSAGDFPCSIFAADLDLDGDADLAVANMANGTVSVLRNNGDGTFTMPTNFAVGTSPRSVVAADVDGDGKADLAAALDGNGAVSVLLNCACLCACYADPSGCDGARDITDVVQSVNVAFRNAPPIMDPNLSCPSDCTDVNCSESTDVVDVVKMVNVTFRNANPATEFCDPCP